MFHKHFGTFETNMVCFIWIQLIVLWLFDINEHFW